MSSKSKMRINPCTKLPESGAYLSKRLDRRFERGTRREAVFGKGGGVMAYGKMSVRALRERLERRIRGIIRGIRLRTGAAGRVLRDLVAAAVARSVRIGAIVDELFARNRGKVVAKVYNWAFGRALAA